MKNGDVLWSPHTDSHEDLIEINNLRDTKEGNFCRVEFSPSGNTYDDVETYVLTIDQERRPDWFDTDMELKSTGKLSQIVRRMIVTDSRKLLHGGAYILSGNVKIARASNCDIKIMMGDAELGHASKSTRVGLMLDRSHIGFAGGNTVIDEMCDDSSVFTLLDQAHVGYMHGRSEIKHAGGNVVIAKAQSRIVNLQGYAQVFHLWHEETSPQIGTMSGNAIVRHASGHSRIECMLDSSVVISLSETASIGAMQNTSEVYNVRDHGHICYMSGRSKVRMTTPR